MWSTPEKSPVDEERRALEIMKAALAFPPEQREAFIRQRCGRPGDEGVLEKALSLLSFVSDSDGEEVLAAELPSWFGDSSGQGRPDELGLTPGEEVGKYRLITRIDGGAYAEVWQAQDTGVHNDVAMKFLRRFAYDRDEQEVLGQAQAEAQAQAPIKDDRIVKVLDADVFAPLRDGQAQPPIAFIVMELVSARVDGEGDKIAENLKKIVRGLGRPMAPERAARVIAEVAGALETAHVYSRVHCDIKPQNILLLPDDKQGRPRPRVTDFGIAAVKAMPVADELGPHDETATHITNEGTICGTPPYMAPEQAAGGQPNELWDVYSLGATLYFVLTGQPPYQASKRYSRNGALDIIHQVRNDPPQEFPRDGRIPGRLVAICKKAMARSPTERYPKAGAFRQDLEHWLRHEPTSVGPHTVLGRGFLWCRRNRLLASLLLTLTLGIAGTSFQWRRAERAFENVEARFYLGQIRLAFQSWFSGDLETSNAALDTCPSQLRQWEWHYLKHASNPELTVLSGHTAEVQRITFSPDGRWIATSSTDSTVRVWKSDGGPAAYSFPIATHSRYKGTSRAEDIAFTGDGRAIAFIDAECVKVHDIKTGRLVFQCSDGRMEILCGLPSSTQIAVVGSDRIEIWDYSLQKQVRTYQCPPDRRPRGFHPDGPRVVLEGKGGPLEVWYPATGQTVRCDGVVQSAHRARFNADGKTFGVATTLFPLHVWDAETGKLLFSKNVTPPLGFPVNFAFSPEGERFAVARSDRLVEVWRGEDLVLTCRGNRNSVQDVAFSPDGSRIASAGADHSARVWDTSTEEDRHRVGQYADYMSLRLLDGGVSVAGVRHSKVDVYDVKSGRTLAFSPGHFIADCAALSPDGTHLACAGSGAYTVEILDRATEVTLRTLRRRKAKVVCVSFSPDGKLLALGGDDNKLTVWQWGSGRVVHELGQFTDTVTCVAFEPSGKLVVSGSRDGSVEAFLVVSGTPIWRTPADGARVTAVAYSPERRLVAVAKDNNITLFDGKTGEFASHLLGDWGTITSLSFSSDGSRLLSGSNFRIRLWDAASGQELMFFDFLGVPADVREVAFSPDGERIFAATSNGIFAWHAGKE